MVVKDIFPTLFQSSSLSADPFWDEAFFYDAPTFEKIFSFFKKNLRACNNDTALQISSAKAICEDLIKMPKQPASVRLMADYLKFQICTVMMCITGIKRLFHPLFHWIANSVSEVITEDGLREVRGGWILDFEESKLPYIKDNFKIDFIQWSRCFFYYMRVMGGHQALTEFYLNHLQDILFRLPNLAFYYPDLDVAFGQILTWASNNKRDDLKAKAANAKMYLYNSPGYPEEWRKNIEFGFACTGFEYTGISQKDWIDIVMKKRTLAGHERLQLVALKYQDNAATVRANLAEILAAIDEYHVYLNGEYTEIHLINYELSRIYAQLLPVLLTLAAEGEVVLANLIISHYFKIPGDSIIATRNLIIVPGTVKGVQYAREQQVVWAGESPFEHVRPLMAAANAFFGWTGVLRDDLTFMAEIPARGAGIPNSDYGNELEDRVVKFFGFEKPEILNFMKGASGYYLLSDYQLPLQALMVKYGQFSVPLIQSFIKPRNARPIKNVLIWQGDSHSSELECNAVQQLFEKKGVNVNRLNWHESAKAQFLTACHDTSYDVVWMSGHGEFDQFEPHLSSLVLYQDRTNEESKNVTIDYGEIQPYEDSKGERRLLVLNICDGATTTLDNSPAAIGLGAKMINGAQSLISHQWPIDPFAGLVHGVLLAIFLSEGFNYQESYEQTIATFLKGKEQVVQFISLKLPHSSLADTLNNNTAIDYCNLFYYGSLSYVE